MWTNHIKCDIFRMRREFIETDVFRKVWKDAGYNEEEMRSLQIALLDNPRAGDGISGSLRKYRHSFGNGGKSSGSRVIYYDYQEHDQIYLLFCFRKNEADNLTDKQKKILTIVVKEIKGGNSYGR